MPDLGDGDGDSPAGFSPDELEVAGILLDLPDVILPRHGLHWGATRRRSITTRVARSPDTPLSFPAASWELHPPEKKPAPKVTSRSTCRDSQRVDSQLKSMVRLQSSNADLPFDLNKLPTETMLHSSEKSSDELKSMVRLQSNNGAGLLLDLNALPPENDLRSSPGESSDQLVPERSRYIIPDLNFPAEESPEAEFPGEDRR